MVSDNMPGRILLKHSILSLGKYYKIARSGKVQHILSPDTGSRSHSGMATGARRPYRQTVSRYSNISGRSHNVSIHIRLLPQKRSKRLKATGTPALSDYTNACPWKQAAPSQEPLPAAGQGHGGNPSPLTHTLQQLSSYMYR